MHALEAFSSLFGLKLAHLLFSVAEQVSSTLQSKDITLKGTLVSVCIAKKYYLRIRADSEFERFYSSITQLASKYGVSAPVLPRQRRRPSRFDGGGEHQYSTPKAKNYQHL